MAEQSSYQDLIQNFVPVKLLEEFFAQGPIKVGCHEKAFLIPRLIKVKDGHKFNEIMGISYSRAREIFKRKNQGV